MIARAGDARRAALIAATLAGFAFTCACSTKPVERPDPAPSRMAAGASASGAAASGCSVDRAARTYVGFSENMSLDDFELAAFEAERILAALAVQLCELNDARDPDGSLRAALQAGALEVTSIVFTQDDAGSADVRVRLGPNERASADASDAGDPPSWLLGLMRTASGWDIVSSTPQ